MDCVSQKSLLTSSIINGKSRVYLVSKVIIDIDRGWPIFI